MQRFHLCSGFGSKLASNDSLRSVIQVKQYRLCFSCFLGFCYSLMSSFYNLKGSYEINLVDLIVFYIMKNKELKSFKETYLNQKAQTMIKEKIN